MRAPLVVVRQVDTQQLLEVPASQDEEPIETVVAHGSHPSFGISVRFWRPDRGANNPDALRAKHLVEGLGEFGVAVMNEELELVTLLTKVAGKVASDLSDPGAARMGLYQRTTCSSCAVGGWPQPLRLGRWWPNGS